MANKEEQSGTAAWRKAQRLRLRQARLSPSPTKRKSQQQRILFNLEAYFPELTGTTIGSYSAFRGEVNLLPFMKEHVSRGGRAALPVVVERNHPLEWWAWTPDTPLRPGIWDIPIPVERQLLDPAILMVPLLGFDSACYRLGNGGGYYDRTLAEMRPQPLCIGVGTELGRMETIYPQPHDIPLDAVVTETGVHWPRSVPDGSEAGSSPVCYAQESPSHYAGYIAAAELLDHLRDLLMAERAGLRQVLALTDAMPNRDPQPVSALLRDEQRQAARNCALLSGLIAHFGGEPNPTAKEPPTPGTTEDDLAGALGKLALRHNQAVDTIRQMLSRIGDDEVHARLTCLMSRHEQSAQRVQAPGGTR